MHLQARVLRSHARHDGTRPAVSQIPKPSKRSAWRSGAHWRHAAWRSSRPLSRKRRHRCAGFEPLTSTPSAKTFAQINVYRIGTQTFLMMLLPDRGADHRLPRAGRGWDADRGALSQRRRIQRRDALQMAGQVWRHEGVVRTPDTYPPADQSNPRRLDPRSRITASTSRAVRTFSGQGMPWAVKVDSSATSGRPVACAAATGAL